MKQVPCEIYTRIVGYFRPISEANRGKREEISERKLYNGDNNKIKSEEV